MSIHLSKLIGRMPHFLPEQSAKLLRIFKAQPIGNFTHRFIGVEYPFFGHFDKFALDVFSSASSCLLFRQIPKIIGR